METIEAKNILDFFAENLDQKSWESDFEMTLGDYSKKLCVVVSQRYCYLPDRPQLIIGLRARESWSNWAGSITLVDDVQVFDGNLVEKLSLNATLTNHASIYLNLVPKPGEVWDSRYNKLEIKSIKFSLEFWLCARGSPASNFNL